MRGQMRGRTSDEGSYFARPWTISKHLRHPPAKNRGTDLSGVGHGGYWSRLRARKRRNRNPPQGGAGRSEIQTSRKWPAPGAAEAPRGSGAPHGSPGGGHAMEPHGPLGASWAPRGLMEPLGPHVPPGASWGPLGPQIRRGGGSPLKKKSQLQGREGFKPFRTQRDPGLILQTKVQPGTRRCTG